MPRPRGPGHGVRPDPRSASAPPPSTSRSPPAACRSRHRAPRPPPRRTSTPRRTSPRWRRTSPPSRPGPAIPTAEQLDYADADVALGGELFRINCAQCHQAAGQGGALTQGKYAPNLMGSSAKDIYQAMLTGPQNMPVFSDAQLPTEQKQEIIAYIKELQTGSQPRRPEPGPLRPGHRDRLPLPRRVRRPDRRGRLDRNQVAMTDISPTQGHSDAPAPAKLGHSPVADVPHRPRATDTDPKAARRAERQVASMFLLSMLFVGAVRRRLHRHRQDDRRLHPRLRRGRRQHPRAGLHDGRGDLPHRRRRHPVGQEAHARRRGRPAAPRPGVAVGRHARGGGQLRARQGRVRLRALQAHPPHAHRRPRPVPDPARRDAEGHVGAHARSRPRRACPPPTSSRPRSGRRARASSPTAPTRRSSPRTCPSAA